MKMMNLGAAIFAAGIATFGPPMMTANAALVVTALEVGSNVVFESTGSLDITGLTPIGQQPTIGFIRGTEGFVFGARRNTEVNVYQATSVPTSFGGTVISSRPDSFIATNPPNSAFGALIGPPVIRLPLGYTSGTPLIYEMQFIGASFASMALSPGTYVWTLPTDTVTLQIGDPLEVTAPPTLLSVLGAVVVGLGIGRRRWRKALAH